MKLRISMRLVIVCVLIILGSGIGIGYAVKAKQAQALNSEISDHKDQISLLKEELSQLHEETDSLQNKLNSEQSERNALEEERDSLSEELEKVKEEWNNLEQKYQDLLGNYNTLQNACDTSTVEEILKLQGEVSSLGDENEWLKLEVARLQGELREQLQPSPDHSIGKVGEFDDWGSPEFTSPLWQGKDYELQKKLEAIASSYVATHRVIPGQFDCNDMAVDLWHMLYAEVPQIRSVIVVGNLSEQGESFKECTHAWLFVFNAEGQVIYLEPTSGEVMYGRLPDGTPNPKVIPYREGWIYEKPSDLREDLKTLW